MATLVQFAEQKRDNYQGLLGDAKSDLSQTTQDLQTAQKKYSEDVSALAGLKAELETIRKDLANALMPADAESLADDFRSKVLEIRKKNADVLNARKTAEDTRLDLAQAQAQAKRASADLKLAQNDLNQDEERAAHHISWKGKITDGTLSDLAAQAQTLLTAATSGVSGGSEEEDLTVSAKQRVEGDIPNDLRTRARERRTNVLNGIDAIETMLNSLEDEYGKHLESDEGSAGNVIKLWFVFDREESAFKDYVQTSQSKYDQALTLFKSVKDSVVLTPAEQDRIKDTDLANNAATALTNEKARDQAQTSVDAKQAEIDIAIAKAIIDDPDADPDADTTVLTLKSELTPLQATLTAAEIDYSQAMRDSLDLWEASVPDHIWTNLIAYDRAIEMLEYINNTNPTTLASAMDTAEATLAQALEDTDKGKRSSDYLEDVLDRLDGKLKFARDARQEWVLSAVRGDN